MLRLQNHQLEQKYHSLSPPDQELYQTEHIGEERKNYLLHLHNYPKCSSNWFPLECPVNFCTLKILFLLAQFMSFNLFVIMYT